MMENVLSIINSGPLIDITKFQNEIYSNLSEKFLMEKFENGDTLFHRLIKSSMRSSLMIKCIYILADSGFDINAQNDADNQTCLHLAVIKGQSDIICCLLQNGADLTITDNRGLCAYNYARRLENKETSKKIIINMQFYYPTYWIGIENHDINVIRRLINSWCRFNLKKNGSSLIDFAKKNNFQQAYDLFTSLETQMELCSAVLACNLPKVKNLMQHNSSKLRMNFKNMRDKGSTVMVYAIRENNLELLKAIFKAKQSILNEYILDELDIDYPIYFAALEAKLSNDCLFFLTPELLPKSTNNSNKIKNQIDISYLYYKGMSFLRYSIEQDLDINALKCLLSSKYCSNELITVKDPEFLTCKEFALKSDKQKYVELIDQITIDYILNSKKFRKQLALNGYDFSSCDLKIEGKDLLSYTKSKNLKEVMLFLENVHKYQEKINQFHLAVEKNDYYLVKSLIKTNIEILDDSFCFSDLFYNDLVNSKRKNESQTVLFKAVFYGYFEILKFLLESVLENRNKYFIKLDFIRDHCFRTPMHYANGSLENKRIVNLLSQFGFSENVFDYLGITPLDFQERKDSDELQSLLAIHRNKNFNMVEPNPWSWQVWTRIQREKDTLKQLISISHPHLHLNQMNQIKRNHACHTHQSWDISLNKLESRNININNSFESNGFYNRFSFLKCTII